MKRFEITNTNKILSAVFAIVFIFLKGRNCSAEEKHDGNFIFHHVQDSYSWHFYTVNHKEVTLHLPVILVSKTRGLEFFSSKELAKLSSCEDSYNGYFVDSHGRIKNIDTDLKFYDISITKTVAALLLCSIVLVISLICITRHIASRSQKSPRGIGVLVDMLVSFIKDDIVMQIIGPKYATKFTPYLLSLFFFIFLNNLLGLLPGAANVTGNISIAFTLAIFTFIITVINGKKNYWKHIFATPGVPLWLVPVMIPIEIIGMFTKPLSLTVRLFANIAAGHIVLLSIINIIFIMKSPYIGIVSVPLGAFMYVIKLLVCFLQAYVFTMLSAIYVGDAVAESNH